MPGRRYGIPPGRGNFPGELRLVSIPQESYPFSPTQIPRRHFWSSTVLSLRKAESSVSLAFLVSVVLPMRSQLHWRLSSG